MFMLTTEKNKENSIIKHIKDMDSSEKVYSLFKKMGYDTPSKWHKISCDACDLRQEEKNIVKKIFSVSNISKNMVIYLVVLNKESRSLMKSIAEQFTGKVRYPLIIFTHDYKNYNIVFIESYRLDIDKHKMKKTFLSFDRTDLKHTDKLLLSRLALTDENIQQIPDLKSSNILTVEDLKKRKEFFLIFLKYIFSIDFFTEIFFKGFEKVFNHLKTFLSKQSGNYFWAHHFSHQLLNRIMFLYFIQKKEWLGKDKKFIINFYREYNRSKKEDKIEKDTFYRDWLSVLFFNALCHNPAGCQKPYFSDKVKSGLTMAPHLNGGLFNKNKLDDNLTIEIPDEIFDGIFDFFERYNFTIKEDMPLEVVVAVDPEMIGRVYESLVNVSDDTDERGEAGIFYTARMEIDFMCRRSVMEYLANHLPDAGRELLYDFVFSLNDVDRNNADKAISKSNLQDSIINLLENVTVVDPACGSGSFLVGMLNILADLLRRAYKHSHQKQGDDFNIKKNIIGKSLYGVDIKEWAVRIAELRLWLQLIIESDRKMEELHISDPLLPNLSFHVRVGDSLVPDIGGFDLYRKVQNKFVSTSTSAKRIRDRIRKHRKNKIEFYNNVKNREYRSRDEVSFYEMKLIIGLIDEEIKNLKEQVNTKNGHLSKESAEKVSNLGEGFFDSPRQTTLEQVFRKDDAKQKKELEKDLEELKSLRKRVVSKDKGTDTFIWDLAFVEIFSGDEKGFDIVIGNPPYVRQEDIAPPNYVGVVSDHDSPVGLASRPRPSSPAEVPVEEKRKYKDRLIEEVKHIYPKKIKNLDKKSDLYIYFYFNGLHLLNPRGVFCFITSNSWLDVGYGRDLQEFLLRNAKIHAIYDNSAKRSFSRADVNTVIALFSAPIFSEKDALNNTARFIQFRKPFEEVINPDNLKEIEKIQSRGYLYEKISVETPAKEEAREKIVARVVPLSQQELSVEGWEWKENLTETQEKEMSLYLSRKKSGLPKTGKYSGDKWSKKHFASPDIYLNIYEKNREKFIDFEKIAFIRRGYTTGANEFFYLSLDEIKNWKIEEEFWTHNIQGINEINYSFISPTETNKLSLSKDQLRKILLIIDGNKIENKENIKQYIKYGESKGFNKRPTCSVRNNWFSLEQREFCDIIVQMYFRKTFKFYLNNKFYINDSLTEVFIKDKNDIPSVFLYLNSTFSFFGPDLYGRDYGGGGAPVGLKIYEVKKLPILIPDYLRNLNNPKSQMFNAYKNKEVKDIFIECGFDNNKPFRQQQPNPLPDRKALDDIVFDILELTDEERKEVYWSVCELVKARLDKAKSL